jgi:hypothetical protein
VNFPIEIRHIETGLAKVFHSLQEVADFLVGKVHDEWEGFQHLGPLPEPSAAAAAAAQQEDEPQTPAGEPALSLAPDGVMVDGVGLVTFEALKALGVPIADAAPARVMRAKLRVESAAKVSDAQLNVSFVAVARSDGPYPADGSNENNTFARWTPTAAASFSIMNPALFDAFATGDEFYADFTAAPKREPAA